MKKTIVTAALTLLASAAMAEGDSVNVELKNASRTVTYRAALLVDGETLTLSNETLSVEEGNEIVALVVNGGKLVLDHCTINKTGDGKSSASRGEGHGQMGDRRPECPEGEGERPMRPEGRPEGGQGGPRGGGRPGGGAPGGGGDDSFNFYGMNSAVVAVGEGSTIELKGCTISTDAEYANAVFSCDEAKVSITDGITIRTSRGSSRGLFATCAGVIEASGTVDISTQGAHCAALATDRGGGTVIVGSEGCEAKSTLNTAGEGSPCIYSTGDITAHNATGSAAISQTMVIEGKNTITITGCDFTGHSPQHGGIMLYQSFSGDASIGTSTLSMKNSTIRDNSGTAMILVTNTHTIVNMENCTLLDPEGNALTTDYPLITCRNCNTDGHSWGRAGSNGGQIEVNLTSQKLAGTLLANEEESAITLTADQASDTAALRIAEGAGTVKVN
ncbi:MAG: hypothetical protein LUI09_04360 [Prevotellaceae bacterium]|nr:hypothetical protein [Prevotellaceae bacterium]